MAETVSYYPAGTENQFDVSDDFSREPAGSFARLDGELFPLVASNAEVVVRCHWMGGAEVSLSTAMVNYPGRMTEENVDQIIADVHGLLANRVDKTEEPEEEDQAPEDSAEPENAEVEVEAEVKAAKPAEKSNIAAEKPIKSQDNPAKQAENPIPQPEKLPTPDNLTVAETGELLIEAKPTQPETAAKTETSSNTPNSAAQPAVAENRAVAETAAVAARSTSEAPDALTAGGQALPPEAPLIKERIIETGPKEAAGATEVEDSVVPAANSSEVIVAQAIEEISLPDGTGIDEETDTAELTLVDYATAEALEEPPELNDEAGTDIQINSLEEDLAELPEEVWLYVSELEDTFPPAGLIENIADIEEVSATQTDIEPNIPELVEVTRSEPLVQAGLIFEEIEESLIELSENIEVADPQTVEVVNEILDKIIEVPAKLEAQEGEDMITEAEAGDELEELFSQLLNKLGIDYTPELIESLTYLTLKWHLADEVAKLKKEEMDEAPQGSGTREIIKKLLAALSAIKKAMLHACAIGRSALRLYSFAA